ncbi:glutamine dumper 2 [Hibiscus trionum]|uniref:Glutamine dumper 2 n=1 Tax=Hibiscus trionum TaxID=183268 RepID=A0A9W7M698_HIBTR|nr:glutamine dumper 2 [Hibiscus trionum]
MSVVAGSTGVAQSSSTWHSPMPFLFEGLAVMLGLVGLVLLIFVCSYCRHFRRVANADEDTEKDVESGSKKKMEDSVLVIMARHFRRVANAGEDTEKDVESGSKKKMKDSVLVIMADEEIPTFLATPASIKGSSHGGVIGDKRTEY